MGNTDEVKELLEGGANVNEPNDVSMVRRVYDFERDESCLFPCTLYLAEFSHLCPYKEIYASE